MTGSVTNLNKARKARDRAAEKAQADANAVKHGRTKAERLIEAARAEKARRALDGAKFEE
jgi:phage protein D